MQRAKVGGRDRARDLTMRTRRIFSGSVAGMALKRGIVSYRASTIIQSVPQVERLACSRRSRRDLPASFA